MACTFVGTLPRSKWSPLPSSGLYGSSLCGAQVPLVGHTVHHSQSSNSYACHWNRLAHHLHQSGSLGQKEVHAVSGNYLRGCVDDSAGDRDTVGVALVEEAAATGVEKVYQVCALGSHPPAHFSGCLPPDCLQVAHLAESPCYLWQSSASWLAPAPESAGSQQLHSQHSLGGWCCH